MICSDDVIMKSWILEQFHIRNDFLWMVNDLNKTYNRPKFIIESKYFKKSMIMNNRVNWFFFKKK